MTATVRHLKYDKWLEEGTEKFGPDRDKWWFVCPACGHVATRRHWKETGAPEGTAAFSCVGR
jgi:hypothetical protein